MAQCIVYLCFNSKRVPLDAYRQCHVYARVNVVGWSKLMSHKVQDYVQCAQGYSQIFFFLPDWGTRNRYLSGAHRYPQIFT